MKKILSAMVVLSILFSLTGFQPASSKSNDRLLTTSEMVDMVGGRLESIICGLAFVQYDSWMVLAMGLGGVSLGIGIGVSLAIGVAGVLICS
jgi:hypothetical protein